MKFFGHVGKEKPILADIYFGRGQTILMEKENIRQNPTLS